MNSDQATVQLSDALKAPTKETELAPRGTSKQDEGPKESRPKDSFSKKIIMKISGTVFQSVLTGIACIVYVFNTYDEEDEEGVFWTLEIVIAVLFSIDYAWGMSMSKDKKKFLLNPLNILDLLTILPVLVAVLNRSDSSNAFMFARILRIIRVVRILRLYRLFTTARDTNESQNLVTGDSSEITKEIAITIAILIAALFISTGVVHTLQQTEQFDISLPTDEDFHFETAFYFIFITATTVGYGDMSPTTDFARGVIGIFIIIIFVIFSQQTTRLGELCKRSPKFKNPYKTKQGKHVVVTGSFNGTTLFRFLKELYHPDHQMPIRNCKVLVVSSEPPNKEMLGILNHQKYEEAITYLEEDFMNIQTLKKACVEKSRGVFILTNQYEDEVIDSDTSAVLASSAVKEYSESTPVFLQLVRPNMLIHQSWAGWETGFSTWKLKLSILAGNVQIPGLSTLISNLVTSSSSIMDEEAKRNHWLSEYIMGMGNELYFVNFPSNLRGAEFSTVCKSLYLSHSSLLIGVQTKLNRQEDSNAPYEILINPVGYFIQEDDKGFVIAPDIEDARGIYNLKLGDDEKYVIPKETKLALSNLRTKEPRKTKNVELDSRFYVMWETDLRGKIWDHILVFGRVEHLEIILEAFGHMTNQIVCYVNNSTPDENWNRISSEHSNVYYLQCHLTDIKELSNTAINFASHAILLSSRISGSSMEDSGILPIITLLENQFTCEFTVELVDEVNIKYLEKRPAPELEDLPFVTWPRYAASQTFYSSALDYFIAQGFHSSYLIGLVQRLIVYDDLFDTTKVDENYRLNDLALPEALSGKVTFGEIFLYLIGLERPIIAIGIYRCVGFLNNELPYVYTKPDYHAPIFFGDKIIVMGELNSRQYSAFLKDVSLRKRKTTLLENPGNEAVTNVNSKVLVRTKSIAENALETVQEEEKVDDMEFEDEEILDRVREMLGKASKERDMIRSLNETLANLSGEYLTVEKLLKGNESLDKTLESIEIST